MGCIQHQCYLELTIVRLELASNLLVPHAFVCHLFCKARSHFFGSGERVNVSVRAFEKILENHSENSGVRILSW